MTEPKAGAGSDPKMLQSTAVKDGDEWVINGHKWWTSDGLGADYYLAMVRTDLDAHPYEGTSIIMVPRDADGVEVVRNVPHLGGHGITEREGGHAEMKFDNVRVPVENTIGEEGEGFQIAQMRLGGGRLTHCMRYSGMAERSLDIAKAYLQEREAFGSKLEDKQALRHRIADAETRLHAARTMVRHAARELDRSDARIEVAMSKMFTANVTNETIDLALQCCGGNGIGKDLPIAHFYENVRAFRIGRRGRRGPPPLDRPLGLRRCRRSRDRKYPAVRRRPPHRRTRRLTRSTARLTFLSFDGRLEREARPTVPGKTGTSSSSESESLERRPTQRATTGGHDEMKKDSDGSRGVDSTAVVSNQWEWAPIDLQWCDTAYILWNTTIPRRQKRLRVA